MSEVRPLAERAGMIDLYDGNGSFVGKANVGVRVMLADGFYVPERTCGELRGEPRHDAIGYSAAHEDDELWCENCDIELDDSWRFCPNCGARIV